LVVTELGLGAMDTPHSPEAAATVEAALDAGVNFIDTAREYEGSEFLLGQVLRARDGADVYLASKTFRHTADGAQRDVDVRGLEQFGHEPGQVVAVRAQLDERQQAEAQHLAAAHRPGVEGR